MAVIKKKNRAERMVGDLPRRHSQWADTWSRLRRNKLAMIGLVIVALLLIVTIFADYIAPYDYAAANLKDKFADLSWKHPFGTDNMGRDILSRVIYGGRISLLVAVVALALSTAVGVIIGAMAGYFGGWCDTIIMQIMDILMGIPQFLMAVSVSTALGTGLMNTAIAVAISGVPRVVRIMRASVMTIRDMEYVEAAKACGFSNLKIIFKESLPNTLAPLIVHCSLGIGSNILAISSLSFIGLGVQPPTPEWGSLLNAGRQYIRDYAPIVIFPGLAIMVTLFGFNLLGDGLRDALDPRLKD